MPAPLSTKLSVHMERLLNDETLCKKMSSLGEEDILRIFGQAIIDAVDGNNRDTIGPTVHAMKILQDTFLAFVAKGDAIIQEENNRKR